MNRLALSAIVVVALSTGVASADANADDDPDRYQILAVPLPTETGGEDAAVLLDTQTGQTWHVVLDDKGRPRWRGIEFAGGTQGTGHLPPEPNDGAE